MISPQSIIKDRYRVGRRLGDGGMAIVYAGHDLHLGRDVAIKVLRPQFSSDPAFRERFAREARAAASLAHPNIIDVYDVGEMNGAPFLVMELVRGQSLKEIIAAEAPFHPDDVAELLAQVGAALDYAHARGYVHRDIKPGNILIDEHGRVRVVDFGIAKGLADSDLTATGTGLGTVGYLSPEQAEGAIATPASDLYATGVVAFEMLTGRLPFQAETPVGVAMQHINEPAPAPSSVLPGVSPVVDAVVVRALDKDPTKRWSSVGALASAMRAWRKGQMTTPAPRTAETASIAPARSSIATTLFAALLVVVAMGALLQLGLQGFPAFLAAEETGAPTAAAPMSTASASDDEPAGSVIDVEAEPDQEFEAEPARRIDIAPTPPIQSAPAPTIAPAGEPVIVVPNLQGLTIAGATGALLPLGLRVALGQPVHSTAIPMNAIVSQDPPAGAAVPAGTVVHVSLSRGPSPFGASSQ